MESPDFSTIQLNRDKPLQSQLHQQLVDWMCSGRLWPGIKLLSSRRLSDDLGISRNTVTLVLEQLKAEGFIRSVPGKGVFVSEELPHYTRGLKAQESDAECGALPPLSKLGDSLLLLGRQDGVSLPFTPGVPDLAAFPTKLWSSLCRRHQDRSVLMGFSGDQGYLPLREALASYLRLSRGVRCDADQILITDGAQQAISLCAQLTLNPGDRALVENPGYRRARQAFLAQGAELRACELNDRCLDVGALSATDTGAKILYTTPTHQYPLGGIMSAGERLRLLEWAGQTGTWILEDDYDSEFCFQQKPVAALQGMAVSTPVLYMGSFSKTLFPSLRIGYLVVPKPLIGAFVQAKSHVSGETSLVSQAVIADFIAEGHFVRHLRRMRLNYRRKWQHFQQLIEQQLSGKARVIGEGAGMHLVVEVAVDDVALSSALRQSGVGSSSLSTYFAGEPCARGLVLGFANTTEQQREACVDHLKLLLESAPSLD